jgi:hypothetical protein
MAAAVVPEPSSNVTSLTMPAPEVISVRRTEEDAGYVSFRPVVRQNFPLNDLLGLVLGVTGKNAARVRQILRSGGVSFHSYRYTWEGFQVEDQDLELLLARFPGPEPSRSFRAMACTAALLEGGTPPRPLLDLERGPISRRRFLRKRSFWDELLAIAGRAPIVYAGYSYQWRADLYRLAVGGDLAASLSVAAKSLAPSDMRRNLLMIDRTTHIVFVCPRDAA